MATEVQIQAAIGEAAQLLEELGQFASVDDPNFISYEQGLRAVLQSDFELSLETESAIAGVRGGLSSALSQGGGLLEVLFREYGRLSEGDKVPFSSVSLGAIFDRLFDDFATRGTPETVKTRALAFGAVSNSGVGDGTLHVLSTDMYGYAIESARLETVRLECIEDQNTGAEKHAETFIVRGEPSSIDALQVQGSGVETEISAMTAADSKAYILNPSFEDRAGTDAVPTDLTGWTIGTGDISDVELVTSPVYRGYANAPATLKALKIKDNLDIKQTFDDRNIRLDPLTPTYVQVAFNNVGITTSTGVTLTLTVGASTAAADVDDAAAGWQILRLPVSEKAWYREMKVDAAEIKLAVAGLGAGEFVLVDDVVIGPYEKFSTGPWLAVVGGETAFLRGKKFDFAITCASDSIIQKQIAERFGRYLPHAASPGWADPTP